MNYYISDLHLNHKNILAQNARPFQSVQEMNNTLLKNWNQKVTDQDDVYILGDLFYEAKDSETILTQLKGKKHLILGNHDSRWLSEDLRSFFVSIDSSLEIIDQNHTIFLCHYPMVSYPKQSRAYMIHGHIHNDTLFDYWPILLNRNRILNAGVDINHFEPVTFNELVINNINYKNQMKELYPMNLLSIRFHLLNLDKSSLSKQDLIETLTEPFQSHLAFYREGLYLIDDLQLVHTQIINRQEEIRNNPAWNKLVKNFDLVHIDEQGNYSYLDYLYKTTIYIK